jgi:hypothetical protein
MPSEDLERQSLLRQFGRARDSLTGCGIELRTRNAGAVFSRDAAIQVFENAVDVTERHEPAGAFRES